MTDIAANNEKAYDLEHGETLEMQVRGLRSRLNAFGIAIALIVILLITQIWSIQQIRILQGELTAVKSEVSSLQYSLDVVQSDLDYTRALAENANLYAHSHNMWP